MPKPVQSETEGYLRCLPADALLGCSHAHRLSLSSPGKTAHTLPNTHKAKNMCVSVRKEGACQAWISGPGPSAASLLCRAGRADERTNQRACQGSVASPQEDQTSPVQLALDSLRTTLTNQQANQPTNPPSPGYSSVCNWVAWLCL